MKNTPCLVLYSCFFALSFLNQVQADQAILIKEDPILVPGVKGGTDFIEFDQQRGRLLAGHPGNGTLDIYDTKSKSFVHSIPTGAANDVAVDAKGGRYIVSVSKQQKVVSVDAEKLTITGSIHLPGKADVLTFNSKNNTAYVGHDDATEIWAIDMNAGKVVASLPIAEGPEALVCDEDANRVYANVKSADYIAVIDADSNKAITSWPTSPAKSPHGLVIDTEGHRLISVGGDGTLVAIDLGSGKVISSTKVSPRVDQIAYDPSLKRVYCASGSGVLSVVDASAAELKHLGDVPTHKGAHAVAVDNKTHAVWISFTEGASWYDGASYIQKLK
jgi:sugar lactone lactonase YvrE